MPAPSTADEFLELVRKSGVVDEKRLGAYLDKLRAGGPTPSEPARVAGQLVRDGILTRFQAEQFLQGRWRRFTIGKYRVLEQIASGGMGSVYLCEHKFMRRRAAVKVLPKARASDPSALERFYREARAVAALDHPNIVRAYDIDQDDNLHFLVMEYVDGSSLQEVVKKSGPLDPVRAAHYISQAALGLQHAHEVAGLVHRDIKPGNLIVDRSGTVKILDMGLARFFHDQDDLLTQKYDENVLGTADYLAPEQALDSHSVDIRADIYSLGATFYFCLTGKTPFSDGTVAQKLIWHQTRQPKPIRVLRPDVPVGLIAVIEKMMTKDPNQRHELPIEVAQALAPWTQSPIAPPLETEMPQLSPAAQGSTADFNFHSPSPAPATKTPKSQPNKAWEIAANPAGSPVTPEPAQASPASDRVQLLSAAAAKIEQAAPGAEPLAPTIFAPIKSPDSGDDARFAISAPASPQLEEESLPWEKLTEDTKDLTGQLDTASPPPKPPASRKSGGSRTKMPEKDRRRLWWVIGGVSGAAVLILVIIFLLAFSGESPKKSAEGAQPETPAQWIVSRSGKENAFPTIKEAAAHARPGDHIVLADATIVEQVDFSNRSLTIEPAPGVSVVWRCPEKSSNTKEILYLVNCRDFHVQGIVFDGGGRVDEGIQLFGNCPGLSLKNLQIRGFNKYGLLLANCAGKPGKDVSIQDVQITTSNEADAALAFKAFTNVAGTVPKINQHIAIRDCRFEGDFQKPVLSIPNASVLESPTWENNTYKSKKDLSPNQLPAPKSSR